MVLFNMPYLAQRTSGLTTAHLPILNPSFQLRSSQVRQKSGVLSSADPQPCGPLATKLMPRVLHLPWPQLPRLHVTLLLPFPLAHHLRRSHSVFTVSGARSSDSRYACTAAAACLHSPHCRGEAAPGLPALPPAAQHLPVHWSL